MIALARLDKLPRGRGKKTDLATEKEAQGRERRADTRIERRDAINLKPYSFPEKGSYRQGRILDLSAGGLLIESGENFSAGTTLKIEMNLTGWQRYTHNFLKYFGSASRRPLVVLAEVVRCSPRAGGKTFEVAVRFTGIDQSHRQALSRFIKAEVLSRR